MRMIGAGKEWRVRPVRSVDGHVQCYAVEHRADSGNWKEWAAVRDHGRAMDLATHLATNFLVVL